MDGGFDMRIDESCAGGLEQRATHSRCARGRGWLVAADVDGDGWLDILVGNLVSEDFRDFSSPNHPGHYNVLFRNNGDLTFTDVSRQAGVTGPPIVLLDSDGRPVLFEDPGTRETFEG